MNIDTGIIDHLPVRGAVCTIGKLQENDSNLWVCDMNIDTEITDGLPGYSSVSITRGLQEYDSNPGVCDMNIDTGIIDYLPVWWGANDTVDYRKMTAIRGYMA